MRGPATAACVATLLALSAGGHAAWAGDPRAASLPGCSETTTHCAPLRLFIPEGLEVDTAWLRAQLAAANTAFAVIDLSFEIAERHTSPASGLEVQTRAARDALGPRELPRGLIDLHLTGRLADVDVAGAEIRGVHWRHREDRARRWIILSTIAGPHVLAHELGHYFGLPHARHEGSLMNKAPDHAVPWAERGFVPVEQRRMRRRLKAMRADGTLTLRRR